MGDIDKLIKKGLDYYGKGFSDEAIQCWRQVLEIDPNQEQAIDYLESAGVIIDKSETVKDLVDRGLDLFSKQDIPGARELWLKAVKISPEDNRAKTFLQALSGAVSEQSAKTSTSGTATLDAREPQPDLTTSTPSTDNEDSNEPINKAEVIELLKQKRYDEVLQKLRTAQQKHKDNITISRSIALIENRMTLEYANKLGNLDVIPVLSRPLGEMVEMDISSEEAFLLSQIDGTITLTDIISLSNLGHFKTYRMIDKFKNKGFILINE